MLIDDIDFADLYRKQLLQAKRTEKKPEHWDKRAEKMAESCASLTDNYLLQLLSKIDLKGAESLFDMGCGPGTVALALAKKMPLAVPGRWARATYSGCSAHGKRTGTTCPSVILPSPHVQRWLPICVRL